MNHTVFHFKQRFGDWILSPSSGGPNNKNYVLVLVPYKKICVFSDNFGSDSILFLTILSMTHACIERLSHIRVEFHGVEMLAIVGGLCCVGFINITGVVAAVPVRIPPP
jgi:hypothetical protein